jgi:glycosyltransferase involved in cell wall biosynthesis
MADALVRMLSESALRERLARAAVEWASRFRWDDCGRRSLDALLGEASA